MQSKLTKQPLGFIRVAEVSKIDYKYPQKLPKSSSQSEVDIIVEGQEAMIGCEELDI